MATVPACSSGTLTNVLPHKNTMPQTQDMTPHPVTVYRHRVDLLLCYPLMWNVTLEYTTTHIMSWVRSDREILHQPSTHTLANAHIYDAGMVVVSKKLSRKYTVPTGSLNRDLWCYPLYYPLAHSCF